jgi:hypothetical protein
MHMIVQINVNLLMYMKKGTRFPFGHNDTVLEALIASARRSMTGPSSTASRLYYLPNVGGMLL